MCQLGKHCFCLLDAMEGICLFISHLVEGKNNRTQCRLEVRSLQIELLQVTAYLGICFPLCKMGRLGWCMSRHIAALNINEEQQKGNGGTHYKEFST